MCFEAWFSISAKHSNSVRLFQRRDVVLQPGREVAKVHFSAPLSGKLAKQGAQALEQGSRVALPASL